MKRFVALLAAAAMVLVAVLIRGAMDNEDGSGSNGTTGSGGQGDLALTCGPELLAACNEIAEEADGDLDQRPARAGDRGPPGERRTGTRRETGVAGGRRLARNRNPGGSGGAGRRLCRRARSSHVHPR